MNSAQYCFALSHLLTGRAIWCIKEMGGRGELDRVDPYGTFVWSVGMNRSRSALLMLITCFLLCPPLQGSQGTGASGERHHGRITCQSVSSMGWLDSYRPARRANLSQFTPWKSRLKTVLAEAVHEFVDERDLGPAVPPDGFVTPTVIELSSLSFSNFTPLRC